MKNLERDMVGMMRKSRNLGAIVALIGAMVSTSVLAFELEVQTFRGDAKVSANPKKLVVLDVAAIDTLDALGVKPVGVPNNLYVEYLKDLGKDATSVGSLFEPDFEAIHALQPDLVVAGGRSSKQFDALSKVAPTIDMTIWGEDLIGQTKARLAAYGNILDKKAEAEKLATAFDAKIEETKASVSGKGKALLVLANGPKVSAYGATSRFGWLHHALGLPEAVEKIEESTHGETISFEFIKDVNPDWLLVIDRSAAIGAKGATAKETLDNALVAETTAWKKGQVVYLDAANIYIASGGIQSMARTMDEIITAFTNAK